MNIPQISSSMISSGKLQNVGIAMLGKQLDTVETAGDMLAASLAAMPAPSTTPVQPHLGGNIDIRL